MNPSDVIDRKMDRLDELMHKRGLTFGEKQERGELLDQYENHWLGLCRERSTVPSLPDSTGGTQLGYDSKVRELRRLEDGELERMLVAHVALCWVHFQETVKKYNAFVMTAESIVIHPALYWERRLSATQRRYLLAVGMLARVRRLARPSLQVNIGQRQVNIADTG